MKKILVSLLMVLLAVPAMAFSIPMDGDEKVSIYGSVRMNLYTDFSGKDVTSTVGGVESTAGSTPFVNGDLHYGMQGNSRFGVLFNLGSVYGQVETNFSTDYNGAVGFRQLWAGYRFENGLAVQVGQQFNIAEASTQFADIWFTDGGLGNYGAAMSFRAPSIRVSMFGATIAIIDDGARIVGSFDNGAFAIDGDAQYSPRFEAAYNLSFDGGSAKFFGSFSDRVYNATATANATNQYDLISTSLGAYGTYDVAGVKLKATGFWGLNASSSTGYSSLTPFATYKDDGSVDKINNVMSVGGALEAGYTINEMFSVIVGAGMSYHFVPTNESSTTLADVTTKNVSDANYMTVGAFIVAPINLGGGFTIMPSVGYYTDTLTANSTTTVTTAGVAAETKTDGKTTNDYLMLGAQFRFNF